MNSLDGQFFFLTEGLTEERKMEKVEATKEKLENLHKISRTEVLYHVHPSRPRAKSTGNMQTNSHAAR